MDALRKQNFLKQRALLMAVHANKGRPYDNGAVKELLGMFRPLVARIALRPRYTKIFDRHVLMDVGNAALMEAILKFDPVKYGNGIAKFAGIRIQHAVRQYALENDPRAIMAVPRTMNAEKLWLQLDAAWMEAGNGVTPNPEDGETIGKLAKTFNVTAGQIRQMAAIRYHSACPMLHPDGSPVDMPDDQENTPEHHVQRLEEIRFMREAANEALSDRERRTLELIHYQDLTFEQAGHRLGGIKKQVVDKIHQRAMRKLKEHLTATMDRRAFSI